MIKINLVRSIFTKIILISKILIKSKYNFYKPKKNCLLIFDASGAFTHYYKGFSERAEILFIKGERVNLYVLLHLVLKLKKISISNYIEEYIKIVKPKFIFHNSFNIRFFEINKKSYNFYFEKIFTQSELKNEFAFNEFVQNKTKLSCDYLFLWNNAMKKLMLKYINGKFFVTGSIINNEGPRIDENKQKKRLLLISQYRPFKRINKNDSIYNVRPWRHGFKYSWQQFHMANIDVAILLKQFCKKNQIEFGIVGTPGNDKNDKEGEKSFFKKHLDNNDWEYLENDTENKDLKKGIHLTANSKYVVTIDSTLGYECLSRGQRVCFFSIRSKYTGPNFISFGWPLKLSQEGPCWTTNNTPKDFDRLMNSLVNEDDNFWDNIRNNILKDIIAYDEGNKKFKAFLKEKKI